MGVYGPVLNAARALRGSTVSIFAVLAPRSSLRRRGDHRVVELRYGCVEDQTSHATQVKEHALASIYKTKEYVLTNGAPRHDAGTLHVYMRLGKALYCAAVRALSLCSCNIHGKYVAQLTCGSVTIKVVIGM